MACATQVIIVRTLQIREIGFFGSYVRQEQTETSDIDVLVEFSETPSLLKFVNLENYLSDYLGVKADLIHKSGLKPLIGERILAEVVYCDQATDSGLVLLAVELAGTSSN